jgi:hypothetical protein
LGHNITTTLTYIVHGVLPHNTLNDTSVTETIYIVSLVHFFFIQLMYAFGVYLRKELNAQSDEESK